MGNISYEAAGVSIDTANDAKAQFCGMVSSQSTAHCAPINKVGAFASLVELGLQDYAEPVFVLKTEEPGSKQMLAIDNGRIASIARDLVNHLINDIIVMGAKPCAVLDTIICGKFEKETVLKLVGEISKACIENNCVLVGGETSEQPGMLPAGRYILQASVLGIVEKSKIIDGGKIKAGDAVIALPSNGLHTNGYSLVRKLMEAKPEILNETVDGGSFLDAVLKPHTSYTNAVTAVLEKHFGAVHGMAHITGGGIRDNLARIIQNENLQAKIDLSAIKIPRIFKVIKNYADINDEEMLKTFNTGVGLIIVADENTAGAVTSETEGAYIIGGISRSGGGGKVIFDNKPNWDNGRD